MGLLGVILRCNIAVAALMVTAFLSTGEVLEIGLAQAVVIGVLGELMWMQCGFLVEEWEKKAATNNTGGGDGEA